MALKKGAQGIIGYSENVAFHPDGSKYFSCFGTAVMFEREARSDLAGLFPRSTSEVQRELEARFSRDTAEAPAARSEEAPGQPAEEDDPVLQRILASQRRTAGVDWQ